jgi:hypothetical protein
MLARFLLSACRHSLSLGFLSNNNALRDWRVTPRTEKCVGGQEKK